MEPTELPPDPARTAFAARTPADVAAFVPLALGFVPERSVVMVSTGPGGGMHARIDLPRDPDDVDDVVEALLRPARLNGVRDVLVVVYDDDTTVADEAAWAIHEEFTGAGITVREMLRVHDEHWFAVLPGAPLAAYQGVRFTLAEHPFTAQSVFDGRVTHPSREALRATISPNLAAADRTATELASAPMLPATAVSSLLRRHLDRATRLSDRDLASLAATIRVGERRDEAWVWLTRTDARGAVDLWSDAVRRLPSTHVAAPAAVLAFVAWLCGDGALAWCAVDRCREQEPGHSLASLVAQLLESATSPDTWESMRPQLDGTADPAA